MSEERNLPPSAKRLREARDRGQIARSKDFHDAVQLTAAVGALMFAGTYMASRLADRVAVGIAAAGDRAHQVLTPIDFSNMAFDYGASLALIVGPVAVASAVGGLAAVSLQGGWHVSWEPLKFNPGKLSPVNGLKRLLPSRAGIDLVRVILLAVFLSWICTRIIWTLIDQTPSFGRMAPVAVASAWWQVTLRMFKQALVLFVILGVADYLVKRWQHHRSLRMTRQEVKDESKMMDGNPEIKGRVRKVQREMVRRRMLAAVPKATVVITNPTHFAVALDYQRGMHAPKVVAMGADHLAQKIKDVARQHGVPLVENVTLARALYANAEIDHPIPMDLFEAVAEVLAYLIRLKQLTL
jgi:flagellar biosynthetic protein FlhB